MTERDLISRLRQEDVVVFSNSRYLCVSMWAEAVKFRESGGAESLQDILAAWATVAFSTQNYRDFNFLTVSALSLQVLLLAAMLTGER